MAGVVTDVAAMHAASGHVRDVNQQMTQTIAQLRADAEGIGAGWQGTAAAAFQSLMARYDESSRRLQNVLAEIADNIDKNGKGYDAREQENLSGLNHASGGAGLDISSSLNIQA